VGLIRRGGRSGRPGALPRRRRGSLSLCAVALAAALLAPAAVATVQPGTPIAAPPGVPDQGRAWELITPPDPISAKPYAVSAIEQNGDALVYMTAGNLPGAPSGYPTFTANVARRGAAGWSNAPIGAPNPQLITTSIYLGPQAVSPDFSTSLWVSPLPQEPGEPAQAGIFRGGLDGVYTPLTAIERVGSLVGTSADVQRIFFTSSKHLLPADATRTEGASLYEMAGSTLRLVDVGNDGSLISNCGVGVVPVQESAISRDGRRVYFLARPSCTGPLTLYLREDGLTTTEIAPVECGLDPDVCFFGDAGGGFAGATADGATAFLITERKLTADDTDWHRNLYRFDVASGALTLVSTRGGKEVPLSNFPVVGVSRDGSHVYFNGIQGYYVSNGGAPRLLASTFNEYQAISGNSRYAAFATPDSLVPEDTDGLMDVYRYDAIADQLTLLSSGPEGGNGPFEAEIVPRFFAEPSGQFETPDTKMHPYRAITDDGGHVFFSTAESLVAVDRDEEKDVYEWANGNLGLITYGIKESIFLGVTGDGRTAFFETSSTLVGGDRDNGEPDFYAARIGGGFPEPPPPQPCEGAACRAAAGPPVARPRPATGQAGGVIAVRPLDRSQLRRIAASGTIELLAEAPVSGRLTAQARARIGARPRTVASTAARVSEPGPVPLRMRLSRAARRSLASGDDLRLSVVLGLPPLRSRTLELVLRAAR
jgi:hypothetical protein